MRASRLGYEITSQTQAKLYKVLPGESIWMNPVPLLRGANRTPMCTGARDWG